MTVNWKVKRKSKPCGMRREGKAKGVGEREFTIIHLVHTPFSNRFEREGV